MKLTGPLYDKLLTYRWWGTPLNGDIPWVILFTTQSSIDDKKAYYNYRTLAKKMEGRVRFAWVNPIEEEFLAKTFEVKDLPQTFLLKDGTAYWYRDFP